jgi:hypothetical protein
MRWSRLLVLGAALVLAFGAHAIARSGFHNTALHVKSYPGAGEMEGYTKGSVNSPTNACIPGRTIKVISYAEHRVKQNVDSVETDSTGHYKGWSMRFPGGRIKVKAILSKIGHVGNRSTCKGDTVIKDFAKP